MNKVITITKDELMEAVAETMASGKVKELLREQPTLILLLAAFGAELTRELFKEEE